MSNQEGKLTDGSIENKIEMTNNNITDINKNLKNQNK